VVVVVEVMTTTRSLTVVPLSQYSDNCSRILSCLIAMFFTPQCQFVLLLLSLYSVNASANTVILIQMSQYIHIITCHILQYAFWMSKSVNALIWIYIAITFLNVTSTQISSSMFIY
jgi:hypothetical protein